VNFSRVFQSWWRYNLGHEPSTTCGRSVAAGLVQLTVRGLGKAKCVALWCALAYNLMHFGVQLIG
jgi:hypothetical protein